MSTLAESQKAGSRGIVYAAFGRDCLDECSVSVATLKARSPALPFVIFTDEPEPWRGRSWQPDDVRPLARDSVSTGSDLADFTGLKIEAIARSPFARTLLLDTDTAVLGDVAPLFELLDRFDIAARMCTPWFGQTTAARLHDGGVPLAFPEFNTGVVLLDTESERTKRFLGLWRAAFVRDLAEPETRSTDQQAFREAVWASDVNILALKPNFNFWGDEPTHMPVVVAHKILNKTTQLPRAQPADLASEICAVAEDEAWSVLSELTRTPGNVDAFDRLKALEFDRLKKALSREKKALKAATEGELTSFPADVAALGRRLHERLGPLKPSTSSRPRAPKKWHRLLERSWWRF
jgi:hypothetical protein